MPAHHVYLVPGFFGFANLGRITYYGESPHVDWLFSGSRFDRRRFEALWSDVAGFIAKGGS